VVGALLALSPLGSGCSFLMTRGPRPVGPRAKQINCSTSKVPALVDGLLVANYLFGMGYTLYQYDAGIYSDEEATAAMIIGLGLTALAIVSADTGISRVDACREAKDKISRRALRQAQTDARGADEDDGEGDDAPAPQRSKTAAPVPVPPDAGPKVIVPSASVQDGGASPPASP
jgi:hypothetical protein